MPDENLIDTISQLQTEVETLGIRGLRAASQEQLKWLRHTRDALSEMGAEFLAMKMSQLISAIDENDAVSARHFLDLLTTLRVFDRVLTLESAEQTLRQLVETE